MGQNGRWYNASWNHPIIAPFCGPLLPGTVVKAGLYHAARSTGSVELEVTGDIVSVDYGGPSDADSLWDSPDS